VLTHNYTGYPMIRQAREMVQSGELGRIRLVQVEYPQDWLSENLEETGQKQAGWRTDPARSGAGRLDRRHRHPCLQPGKLRLGPGTRRALRRSRQFRRRPKAR
jgi:hypothetical protein